MLATKWMDFWFSDVGVNLCNYGIEGTSYEMVDGKPVFTDMVVNCEGFDGLSNTQVANYYSFPLIIATWQDGHRLEQFYTEDQIAAIDVWGDSQRGDYVVSSSIALTAAEQTTVDSYMDDIRTYVSENALMFVMGVRSLDEYDDYTAQLDTMHIDECVKVYQDAVDRYNQR